MLEVLVVLLPPFVARRFRRFRRWLRCLRPHYYYQSAAATAPTFSGVLFDPGEDALFLGAFFIGGFEEQMGERSARKSPARWRLPQGKGTFGH